MFFFFLLQEVYGLPSGPNHLDAKSVQEGGHYAWLHHTTHVYERVEISQHLGSLVSLLLLDRGEIVVVQVTTLRPLLPEFARLPAQALQAKLHGTRPFSFVLFFKFMISVGDALFALNFV